MPRNRGRKKGKLRDYSRATLTHKQARALTSRLTKLRQNPITIAILGAIAVEHELDEILRGKFKRND